MKKIITLLIVVFWSFALSVQAQTSTTPQTLSLSRDGQVSVPQPVGDTTQLMQTTPTETLSLERTPSASVPTQSVPVETQTSGQLSTETLSLDRNSETKSSENQKTPKQ